MNKLMRTNELSCFPHEIDTYSQPRKSCIGENHWFELIDSNNSTGLQFSQTVGASQGVGYSDAIK